MAVSIYDEIADLFMASLAGEVSGVTREQFIDRVRKQWPTEKIAREQFDILQKRAAVDVAKAERDAAARGQKIVGIGYPVKK